MTLLTNRSRAYVNYGRWVADCAYNCGSAKELQPGEFILHCVECKSMSEIEWPDDPDGIWEALLKRPAPRNRNWYPSGHVLALRSNIPHGQTVKELHDETAENAP